MLDAPTRKPLAAAPDLISFDDNGRARDESPYLFDVERNWLLAKALLTHPRTRIQFLFVSTGLKQLMLDHARAIGEPDAIIERAEGALTQPTGSSPHDDHFHLRIACDVEDRLRGCVDRGPRWEWVDWHDDALLARTVAMREALRDPDTEVRLRALDYILAIESPFGPEFALVWGMDNDREQVRERALDVANSFYSYTGAAVEAMASRIRQPSTTFAQRAQLYAMMRRSLDPWTIPFVQERLLDEGVSISERVLAARALSHQMDEALVPYLLDQLLIQPTPVRVEIATILRRVTNRSEPIDWASASQDQAEAAHDGWRAWWAQNRDAPREVWVARGMAEALGVEPQGAMSPRAIEPMLTALPNAPDYLLYNINLSLRQITGRWASLEQRDGGKLQAYWLKWWRINRGVVLSHS